MIRYAFIIIILHINIFRYALLFMMLARYAGDIIMPFWYARKMPVFRCYADKDNDKDIMRAGARDMLFVDIFMRDARSFDIFLFARSARATRESIFIIIADGARCWYYDAIIWYAI